MVSLKVLETKVTIPSSGVKIEVPNTKAVIADQDFGSGILCVAESNLIWKKDNEEGLCIEYPHIALHAVSRDLVAYPNECIYVMLDTNILKGEENDSESEDEESENTTVIRFVPGDNSQLNPIFVAMNECQALYPDSEMSGDEEDKYDQIGYSLHEENFADANIEQVNEMDPTYFTAETSPDDIVMSAKGQEVLRRLNINFQNQSSDGLLEQNNEINADAPNKGQFEDADLN